MATQPATAGPRPVEVEVVRTGKGCLVSPAHRTVTPGNTITWRNVTGAQVTLFIPDGNLFGKQMTQAIAAGGNWTSPPAQGQPTDPSHYPYAVYCDDVRDFAEGGSHPDIICG